VAFDVFVNADDEAERNAALGRHRQSMITHIRTLSGKDYHTAAGSPVDYVIMFVPIEGALAAALNTDPGLTAFAVENNVAIATPTTLMIALRTVNNVWQVERRNRNAEQIASRAGLLYEKLVNFVSDMTAIETSLNRAQKSYGDAMSKLSTGGGNLIRQAEQLKELGAKTRRSLPVSLTGDDTAEVLADIESLPGEG
jgi:DNA recombination protein RmuC